MKTAAQIIASKENQNVYAIAPSATVLESIRLMAEKGIGALLVMEADRLVGIISERDYARKMVLQGRSSIATPVSEIMTRDVISVGPRESIQHCMELMTDGHLRHLPVLDEAGLVIGLLSIGDLVKNVIAEQQSLIQQLEQYIRGE